MTTTRSLFLIDLAQAQGEIVRILNLFVVQGAWLHAVSLDTTCSPASLRLEISGLDATRTQVMRQRLAGLTGVKGVSWGQVGGEAPGQGPGSLEGAAQAHLHRVARD